MNESGWDTSPPAPGRSLNSGHRSGRRAAASGHRADYSDSRDRTDAPSTPGRRAAYQLNVEPSPHRTPSPVPGRRPPGRRASVPLSDDWDDDAEGDLPYASPPPTASWRHQTASIPIADLDEDDDAPTVPQPERPQAAQPPQAASQPSPQQPAQERYEFEFEYTDWSQPAVQEPEPGPYQSYQPTYEPPRYEPPRYDPEPRPEQRHQPEPEPEWTPSWEQHTQAWSPDELSHLLDNAPEQTSTSLFSAQPYVDRNADILPVEGYADELLGSDALGPGALPTDPEVHPAFPNDVLDHAIDAQAQADPLSDPVARWEQEQPPRQPARGERPLFADDPYTLPQRMAQRDLQRAQDERDYAPPQHQPPRQAQQQPRQLDLPPVQLTSADRGRPQRKPRPSGMPGKLAILVSFGASLATAGIDLMLTDRLGLFFMLSSVLTAFGIAAAIRRPDVFTAGVLPPLAALGTFIVLGVLVPERLSGIESQPTAILAALASESWTLVAATGLALGTIAIRVAISRPPKQEEEPEPAPRQTYRNAA